jgi:uncharacterized repeat protein (TIGR01451 family)
MHAKRAIALLMTGLALAVVAILVLGTTPAAPAFGDEEDWYWKDGGWPDYAINGVPDFDQKQIWFLQQGPPWTYCGPVAAANSLWWFDSKFEPYPLAPLPLVPPPGNPPPNDNYYLVASYLPGVDDHDPGNVGGGVFLPGLPGLVDDLAWHFDTDDQRPPTLPTHQGTRVRDMFFGLQWYLYGTGPSNPIPPGPLPRPWSYYDEYHLQMVKMPTWDWVVEEVERSEDVILLLGFWQMDPTGGWWRLGGHYVTVAGTNDVDLQIAFSDPFFDNAELTGVGYVHNGVILPHAHPPPPGWPDATHNDAGNVSHDTYSVMLAPTSPGGAWEILGYPYAPPSTFPPDFWEQNVPDEFVPFQGYVEGAPVLVEVEYAIAMSPFSWKAGGEWVHQYYGGEWIWEWWWYEDDGHSCLPDFAWGGGEPFYDGPTAVANSLWWFDSKAETLVTGGFPTPPPAISDHYPLVESYDPTGLWDDHDPQNTLPFIDDLAGFLNTTPFGTTIPDMESGIRNYLESKGVAADYYIRTQDYPPFEWVADEVETSEDVIMLLGFYEHLGGDVWERKGGHWVNAAGVGRDGGLIGLSDPYTDTAWVESFFDVVHTGRVFPPEHLGTPFTPVEKLDPQGISHDIYATGASASDPGWLTLEDYPVPDLVEDFVGMNGDGFPVNDIAHDFEARLEWAIGVSPYSELVLRKTAEVVKADPGQEVLIVLEYSNKGLAAAENVTITDLLDTDLLTGWRFEADPPISATEGVTYEWTLPRLSYGQGGIITVAVTSDVTWCLSNTASITGQNAIGTPTPDGDPSNNVATILGPDVAWKKLIYVNDDPVSEPITLGRHDAITITDQVWLTYTQGLTFTLVETWSESLELTGWLNDSGTVISTSNVLTWEVANAAPDTWHTLVKTFEAKIGIWITDWITEALDIECIGCDQRVITFEHPPYRLYLPLITRDYDA